MQDKKSSLISCPSSGRPTVLLLKRTATLIGRVGKRILFQRRLLSAWNIGLSGKTKDLLFQTLELGTLNSEIHRSWTPPPQSKKYRYVHGTSQPLNRKTSHITVWENVSNVSQLAVGRRTSPLSHPFLSLDHIFTSALVFLDSKLAIPPKPFSTIQVPLSSGSRLASSSPVRRSLVEKPRLGRCNTEYLPYRTVVWALMSCFRLSFQHEVASSKIESYSRPLEAAF